MKTIYLFAFIPLLFAGSLAAADEPESLVLIMQQQHELQADLDAGRTQGLTPREVATVRKAQREVFALAEGKPSLDALSLDQKVQLENALERINALVKGGRVAQDEQQVCWRERKSGSTMKVTRCGTEAERREAREGARAFLERPRVCAGDCGNQL